MQDVVMNKSAQSVHQKAVGGVGAGGVGAAEARPLSHTQTNRLTLPQLFSPMYFFRCLAINQLEVHLCTGYDGYLLHASTHTSQPDEGIQHLNQALTILCATACLLPLTIRRLSHPMLHPLCSTVQAAWHECVHSALHSPQRPLDRRLPGAGCLGSRGQGAEPGLGGWCGWQRPQMGGAGVWGWPCGCIQGTAGPGAGS